MPTKQEVVSRCSDGGIEMVRLLFVGNDGVARGRVIPATEIEGTLENGVNLSSALQSFNSLDHLAPNGQFGAAGEIRLLPDPNTFQELPYADQAGVMLCDMYDLDQTPWNADPRSALRSFIDWLSEEGYELASSFESEFYLVEETEDGLEPFDDSVCFGADGMQTANDIVLDMVNALRAQKMDVNVYYPEYGPGQQELVVKHDSGITAADNFTFYKQTIKSVARQHEVDATFLPKPFQDAAGSGCHIHVSLWDGDENVFYDTDSDSPYGLSGFGRHFVGGLLDHAPALVAVTAPTISSYKRLRPQMWASAFTCWGEDNREAIVRVPSAQWSDPAKTTHVEFKPSDNTTNPYLALLAVLAAGMDGVEKQTDPGQPVNQDPTALTDEEQAERGIKRLPTTLGEALEAFADDDILVEAFGETLHSSYLEVKRSHWNEFTGTVTDWEMETLGRSF